MARRYRIGRATRRSSRKSVVEGIGAVFALLFFTVIPAIVKFLKGALPYIVIVIGITSALLLVIMLYSDFYFKSSKLSRDINWEVLYYANNGRLEWLEYNIKRALLLETDIEEEQQLGINEVRKTIEHVVYYDSIKKEILKLI